MRHSTRFILAASLAAGLVATLLPSPSQAFTTDEAKCRAAVAKNGSKFAKTAVKAMTTCHKGRDGDGSLSGTDCNDIAMTPTASKVTDAEGKFDTGVAKKCVTGAPADMLYASCPAPCAATVPSLVTFGDVVDCEVCLARAKTEDYSSGANGSPTSPLSNDAEAACHKAMYKESSKFFNSAIKSVTKCQASFEKLSPANESTTTCTTTDYTNLVATAYTKCFQKIQDSCGAVSLPNANIGGCGTQATAFDLATCTCDAAKTNAQVLASRFLDLSGPVATTTTTTMPGGGGGDPQCPNSGELVIFSKMSNQVCANNGDCAAPYFCNTTSLRCETVADLDTGWTGIAHDSDINDGVTARARLLCNGPGPVCGECTVEGIDPSPGNCRCANNIRNYCDQPFQADANDCGGAICNCYFGAPFPLNSAGVHVCVVNRFAKDVTGTANVDLGSGDITADLKSQVFSGFLDTFPCPVCGGTCSQPAQTCMTNADCTVPSAGLARCTAGICSMGCVRDSDCGMGNTCIQDVPDDRVRNGFCIGDNTYTSRGLTCDVNSTNASFPAIKGLAAGSGGGGYSIDCQPAVGKNISGSGLHIVLDQTTGTQSMGSAIDCDQGGPNSDLCPCLQCTKDTTDGCRNNADCAVEGNYCSLCTDTGKSSNLCSCNVDSDCQNIDLGTCSNLLHTCTAANTVACANNNDCLATAHPDAGTCTGVSTCTYNGGGLAQDPKPNQCATPLCDPDLTGGPNEGVCNAGPTDKYCDGLVRADGTGMKVCTSDASCAGGYGTCTLLDPRDCFLDPIVSEGTADPTYPVAGAVFCVAATSSSGVNGTAGLPGPGRVLTQSSAKTFCASNPAQQYVPGVGGCP